MEKKSSWRSDGEGDEARAEERVANGVMACACARVNLKFWLSDETAIAGLMSRSISRALASAVARPVARVINQSHTRGRER